MTPEERELKRALEARSGEVTPQFRARLSSTLSAEGRPSSNFLPALAAVAAVALVFATVGVLLLARQSRNQLSPIAATTPTANPTATPSPDSSPSPEPTLTPAGVVRGVLVKPPHPIALPANAQLSASPGGVLWALMVDQYLYRSVDGGATWQQRPLPPNASEGFPQPQVSFVSDQEGWLTTGGSPETQCNAEVVGIWHTTDAGATWQSLGTNGVSNSQCKGELSFVDANRGYLDGSDPNRPPVIYRTVDGGRSWSASKPLPDPPGFKTVGAGFNLQPGPVHAFGSTLLVPVSGWQESGTSVQYAFQSTDGGAAWTYLARGKDAGIQIVFVTATRWLQLVNAGQSFETTDAGATWHQYPTSYSQAAGVAADFVFANALVGYGTVRGGIARTVDGGLHWVWIRSPGT